MSSFPCLVRRVPGSGQVRYALGHRLVDRYLEFVAGRSRPNTLRAVAFDLKVFFAGLGAPEDIDVLKRRITHLEQTVVDLTRQLEERGEELDAARAANREMISQLNAAPRVRP